MHRWRTGKDGIILINYFQIKFKPLVDHWNNYQKYLSDAALKNICWENFLEIIIKTFVTVFFSKTPCFQNIFMNAFRRMRLNCENCSLFSDYKSLIVSNFDGKTLKMKAVNDI